MPVQKGIPGTKTPFSHRAYQISETSLEKQKKETVFLPSKMNDELRIRG